MVDRIRTKLFLLLLPLAWSSLMLSPLAADEFPVKPVKIIVYTGPGGLIDITARKFAQVASKYADVNFVVENKPGAGGIVALKKILQAPADGYSIYACTKSNIAKFVQSGGEDYVNALEWTAMLMADPECVITNNQQETFLWTDLVADARLHPGQQNWVGPAAGGLDHVTAMKIWETAGMQAKWIPYKSGGKAIAALLGEQGVAYVGNPRDAQGNPDLHIAAVSSPRRLDVFPDIPTFADLGLADLSNEFMWRGLALKKGTPTEISDWYIQLCRQVTDDPEWRRFWAGGGIQVALIHGAEFADIVEDDVQTFSHYLRKSEIIADETVEGLWRISGGWPFAAIVFFLAVLVLFSAWRVQSSGSPQITGRIVVTGFFLVISIAFFLQTIAFPVSESVGPAAIPRLWIYFLIPLNLLLLVRTIRNRETIQISESNVGMVLTFAGFLIVYLASMVFIGYFISTFVFLIGGFAYLGHTNWKTMLVVSAVWILFSYVVFYRILFVPLPLGMLLERFF